jgi:hypothetical protein
MVHETQIWELAAVLCRGDVESLDGMDTSLRHSMHLPGHCDGLLLSSGRQEEARALGASQM